MLLNNQQSTIYHSCEANSAVEFLFHKDELVVNAQTDISAGEEILISYLNECELERSRHSRYKMLGKNYLFNCDCMNVPSQVLSDVPFDSLINGTSLGTCDGT